MINSNSNSEQPTIRKSAAVVLAGGHSRRMGVEKAQLAWRDTTLLQHICRTFASAVPLVVVVGRANQDFSSIENSFDDSVGKLEIVFDRNPDRGPLEALATGLEAIGERADYAWVSTCDSPLVRTELFHYLLEQLDDFDAVFPQDEQHIFGLTAVYRVGLAKRLRELSNNGQRKIIELPLHLRVRLIDKEACRQVDPDLSSFENVNTPAEYQQLRAICGGPNP